MAERPLPRTAQRIVMVDVIHGARDRREGLSVDKQKRIIAATFHHLCGSRYDAAVCVPTLPARETLELAFEVLNHPRMPIVTEEYLDPAIIKQRASAIVAASDPRTMLFRLLIAHGARPTLGHADIMTYFLLVALPSLEARIMYTDILRAPP